MMAESIVPVSKFVNPSVKIPQTFFLSIKRSFIHLISGVIPKSFFMLRHTATALLAVIMAGFVIPPFGLYIIEM